MTVPVYRVLRNWLSIPYTESEVSRTYLIEIYQDIGAEIIRRSTLKVEDIASIGYQIYVEA